MNKPDEMSFEQHNEKKKVDMDVTTESSTLLNKQRNSTDSSPITVAASYLNNNKSIQSINCFSSLSSQLEDFYGGGYFSAIKTASTTIDALIKSADKARGAYNSLPKITAGYRSGDSSLSKWLLDTCVLSTNTISSVVGSKLEPSIKALSTLEARTALLASNLGISKITSVTSQISSISDLVSSLPESVREMIAPSSMLADLKTVALEAHNSILDVGSLPNWKLGVIDSASYMVDRQVGWTSQLCNLLYGKKPFVKIEGLSTLKPKVNIISLLPSDLEEEKRKKVDITPKEALEKSTIFRLSEKGKMLIDKVVDINRLCESKGHDLLFKYTGATTRAAAIIGGTICLTKEAFGNIIDSLYMLFYENIEHIKMMVSEEAVKDEEVYQCIFRLKNIRTDFRHDYEHGSKGDIKKKKRKIEDSYFHYAGKPVLMSRNDYLVVQEKLYDEFDALIDHLYSVM